MRPKARFRGEMDMKVESEPPQFPEAMKGIKYIAPNVKCMAASNHSVEHIFKKCRQERGISLASD